MKLKDIQNMDLLKMLILLQLDKNVQDDTAFGGYRIVTDHAIKISMAKEISMIQRNGKGKQAIY